MPNPPAAGSYYRTFSDVQPISTALPKGNAPVKITTEQKGRKKRKGKLGEHIAIPSEGTKKRKRKVTKEQEQERRRMQQQAQQKREERERQMQILQMELEAQQLMEQQKQEQARKEREFHTHQRRFVQQQRLQEGQHAWKLEWQRQQPHLRELLRTEELLFQAQETSRKHDISLSDMVNGENLHDFAQPN